MKEELVKGQVDLGRKHNSKKYGYIILILGLVVTCLYTVITGDFLTPMDRFMRFVGDVGVSLCIIGMYGCIK